MATDTIKDLVEQAGVWPDEDQQELVDYARVIEARRTGQYRVTNAERAAISEGLAQADLGELVAEDLVTAAESHHRL